MTKKIIDASDRISHYAESWKADISSLIPPLSTIEESSKYHELIELIDWYKLSEQVIDVVKTIMETIAIPQINPSLKFNSAIVEGIILANIKSRLDYIILVYFNNILESDNKAVLIKNLLNKITSELMYCRAVYETVSNSSNIKFLKDSKKYYKDIIKELESSIEKSKPFTELGRKFWGGRKNRTYEVEAFNKIDQIYHEKENEGLKSSLRSIALHVARTRLGLEHAKEQVNFYKRYIKYKKNKK